MMKRNSCLGLKKVLGLLALFFTSQVFAQEFDEGIHFSLIHPQPEIAQPASKIEVIEFFMHACPHCYHFEPKVKAWLKNKAADIEFIRMPAPFGRHFDLHAKMYFALQSIGEASRLHDIIFYEIHENKNALKTPAAIDKFLASQQVDMPKFNQAFHSFAVGTKFNQAKTLLGRYRVDAVPSLVIDGRYKSGSGLSQQEMIDLIDFLAKKVRQQRQVSQ